MANSPFIFGANGATSLVPGGVTLPGATSGTLQVQPAAATTTYSVTMPPLAATGPSFLQNAGSSGVCSWQNTQPSNITGFLASGFVGTATNPNAIVFPTKVYDTNAAYNAATGQYTVPASGYYLVGASLQNTLVTTQPVSVYINGVASGYYVYYNAGVAAQIYPSSVPLFLTSGQIITLVPDSTFTSTGNTYFWVVSLGATQSVSTIAFKANVPATTFGTGPITGITTIYDTNNGGNPSTGQYTIPYAGYYLIGANIQSNAGSFNLETAINGSPTGDFLQWQTTTGQIYGTNVPRYCSQGDIVTWYLSGGGTLDVGTVYLTSIGAAAGSGLTEAQVWARVSYGM